MIYSQDIDKKCAVCQYAEKQGEDEIYCAKKKQTVPFNSDACDKFCYDILKRNTRRRKKLKTNFNPEDFKL